MRVIRAEELGTVGRSQLLFTIIKFSGCSKRKRDDGTKTRGRGWPPAMSTFMTSSVTENSNTDTVVKCRRT